MGESLVLAMNKYVFINKLMQIYYDGLNYLQEHFGNEDDYYKDLNSEEVAIKLYTSISEFIK